MEISTNRVVEGAISGAIASLTAAAILAGCAAGNEMMERRGWRPPGWPDVKPRAIARKTASKPSLVAIPTVQVDSAKSLDRSLGFR